ncbi:C1 family peptidase [Sulfurovum mangrovi]|uniref:C1 family peptidase n=1 Tax=Sulfurovum mangrovi TaxID=2893889 RepID=UPI001E4C12C2|nr:C1 family peptidase [Sulfurovum mangrovi]UFH58345.1 C1 family peptidase [Sulfurovum mangrovi]
MANTDYIKNVEADFPDNRDWLYRPNLQQLKPYVDPPAILKIRNQGREGACTGFALAAAIDYIKRSSGKPKFKASARMLYEMAKRHDEWPKEDYEGSSLRGAIQGWKNNGVCSEASWPYDTSPGKKGELTVEKAKEARQNTIGAYYRIRPVLSDFHSAICEIGVIVVSAKVHKNWDNPTDGVIAYESGMEKSGGHAFAIVGYNDKGFWVQNSWGTKWGRNGLALWLYEDWIENVMDAWGFRLALPTPQVFGKLPLSSKLVRSDHKEIVAKPAVNRDEIAGHFVHIDDGRFAKPDKYWSDSNDVKISAEHVAESDYEHILFYGHGGLNSPKDSARRILAMKETFKKNGIYPYHIMYDTGIIEELKDLLFHKGKRSDEIAGGFTDWTDTILEHLLSVPGTLLWDEMKKDAKVAFKARGAGKESVLCFLEALKQLSTNKKKKIHIVGHSTGAVLFAHFLRAFSDHKITIESVSLMAPACNLSLYNKSYLPILQNKKSLKVKKMFIYNLNEKLERDDNVAGIYRKSLLYLVSNAFESGKKPRVESAEILGMEKYSKQIETANNKPVIYYSNGQAGRETQSTSHGGFDNDPVTMNSILKTILGKKPEVEFTKEILNY